MDRREYLARQHRRVVDEFILAVVEEWAGNQSILEQNLLGSLLRSELEDRLVPALLAVDALLMKADAQVLGKDLPEWLNQVSTVLPAEAEFLSEMGRRVDPVGSGLLEENSVLSTGESLASRAFVDHLWEMAPLIRTGPLVVSRSCYPPLAWSRFLALYCFLYSLIRVPWTSHIIVPPTLGSSQSRQMPRAFRSL